jgi:HAE1 family hydrophobic/amphiphilic exporter-1
VNPAASPILYLALTDPLLPLARLYDYAHTYIADRLSMIEGVSQVITYGSKYAVRIQVDPERLAGKGIGIHDVAFEIDQSNVDLPTGSLWNQERTQLLDVDGQLLTAEGYGRLFLRLDQGSLLPLNQVGRALDSVEDDKFSMFYETPQERVPCLVLALQRLPGENTMTIIDRVNQALEELVPQLPSSLKVQRLYDRSESVREGVLDVQMTLLIALALVVLIIYLSLGSWKATWIPSLSIPLSILGTFVVMYGLGYSIDVLSLLALTLSVGFLVDDAIVVLENGMRHVEQGMQPKEAALQSGREISVTVMSITLALMLALLPLLLMGGVLGRLFREFGTTLIVAILFSGLISLSLTPMLISRLSLKSMQDTYSHRLIGKMSLWYHSILSWALRHTKFVVACALGSLILSWALFIHIPVDFLPPDDVGFIQGFTLSQEGTSFEKLQELQTTMTRAIVHDPNVDSLISFVSLQAPNEGIIFIRLKPFGHRAPMEAAIDSIQHHLDDFCGIQTFLSPLPLINFTVGTTSQALYQYSLISLDSHALYDQAERFTETLRGLRSLSQVSSDLRITQPTWKLSIDRTKAFYYGLDAKTIETFFSYAYSNLKVATINAPLDQYDVILETLPWYYKDPTVLSKLYVQSNVGALVPLGLVLDAKETVSPSSINHINGLSAVNISFNTAPNVPLSQSIQDIENVAAQKLGPQIQASFIGTAEIFRQSFQSLGILAIIAGLAMYVLLGILYEHVLHPVTVMSALPCTVLGGLLTLFLTGMPMSIYSFVGLILLMGIVLKNGILLVDVALRLQKTQQGCSAQEAILQAAVLRFRPIMMTTLSSAMGALPIALGLGGGMAQNRMALGIVILGGLVLSQLITLLVTPTVYVLFDRGGTSSRPR